MYKTCAVNYERNNTLSECMRIDVRVSLDRNKGKEVRKNDQLCNYKNGYG